MSFLRLLPWTRPVRVSARRGRERVLSGAILLDVRRGGDWRSGHAPGSIHVPLDELADRAASLPTDRAVVVLAYSGAGGRAATRILGDAGLTACAVRGGLDAWVSAGGRVQRDDAAAGDPAQEDRMSAA